MVKINFSIPKNLDKKIEKVQKEKGFMSKSEFFRHVMINYIEENQKPRFSGDEDIEVLVNKIEDKIKNSDTSEDLEKQLGLNE